MKNENEEVPEFHIPEEEKKEYQDYIKKITPMHCLWKEMLGAFVVGGAICLLGQIFMNQFLASGMDKEAAGTWTSITLVGLAVLATGFHQFSKLVKIGGAGALVPITGFANSIAAPAIEFQTEGQVFGIGCKIFTIAGPVILYGLFSSWLLGAVYWIGGCFGWW